jgi:hypothetical protein
MRAINVTRAFAVAVAGGMLVGGAVLGTATTAAAAQTQTTSVTKVQERHDRGRHHHRFHGRHHHRHFGHHHRNHHRYGR